MPSLTKNNGSETRAGALSADAFLGGRLSVVQPRDGHRAGSDAVFLAAGVKAEADERVLDAGAGVGVAGLCLLARAPGLEVTAVELDAGLCALAETNAARNGFAESFNVVNADVTWPGKRLAAAGLIREGYDHVIANPPFHDERAVRAAPHEGRAAAHVMAEGGLAAWIRFLTAMTAPKGTATLIHRPEHLDQLLDHLRGRFGDVAVFPLYARRGDRAARVIVQGRKGSRAPLRLLPGLVLHQEDGTYTPEAEAVLRGGEALQLGA